MMMEVFVVWDSVCFKQTDGWDKASKQAWSLRTAFHKRICVIQRVWCWWDGSLDLGNEKASQGKGKGKESR